MVEQSETIEYVMADGRKVKIGFIVTANAAEIIESFDPENDDSGELQQKGWQAILNNFKIYVESI